tara:strand:- start:106 stop:396 length:291 start_codon:yes stop_codon:yes gene_type:complete
MDFNDYDSPETALFDQVEFQSEIFDLNICTLESYDTDMLTFRKAFGYYRKCLSIDNNCKWKGMKYTTPVSKEIIIQMVDSIQIEGNPEDAELSNIR